MSYESNLNRIDKLRNKQDKIDQKIKKEEEKKLKIENNIKKEEQDLINKFYIENPMKKIEAFKRLIEKVGADWQRVEFIDFYQVYKNKQLTIAHIRYFNSIHKQYGAYIKYTKSFEDKLALLWKGADKNDEFSDNNSV